MTNRPKRADQERSITSTPDDVLSNVWPEPNSGCWFWEWRTNLRGYGVGKPLLYAVLAHRWSWIVHNGPIPDGLFVLHKCDQTSCINPDHLFLGTHIENMKDMTRKGRHPSQFLTSDQIEGIILMRKSGATLKAVGAKFGCSWKYVSDIYLGKYPTYYFHDKKFQADLTTNKGDRM